MELSLKLYEVDLQDYKGEEFDRLYRALDGNAWTADPYASMPKKFLVSWILKQSIAEVTGISADKIREIRCN